MPRKKDQHAMTQPSLFDFATIERVSQANKNAPQRPAQPPRPLPAPQPQTKKIEDTGKFIPFAKKHIYAFNNINQIRDLPDVEAAEAVTLNRIWPEPDYSALHKAGTPLSTLALRKAIRSCLARVPKETRDTKGRNAIEAYAHFVMEFRDLADHVISTDDYRRKYGLLLVKYQLHTRKSPWHSKFFCINKKKRNHSMEISSVISTYNSIISSSFFDKITGKEQETKKTTISTTKRTDISKRPHLAILIRKGPDKRTGDVTPQQFIDEFCFSSVQFGNYLPNDERQSVLNMSWDALHDLADLIGVPPSGIGFNRQLAAAFGSRGSGNAAAHYEPGLKVFNITRISGAGSLAHEWFHAFDNISGTIASGTALDGLKASMLSGRTYRSHDKWLARNFNMTDEDAENYFSFLSAMTRKESGTSTFYYRYSCNQGRKDYHETPLEMAARAFETWVSDKLDEMDRQSDYLVHSIPPHDRPTRDENGQIIRSHASLYPLGQERKAINNAIDKILEVIRKTTRTTSTDRWKD